MRAVIIVLFLFLLACNSEEKDNKYQVKNQENSTSIKLPLTNSCGKISKLYEQETSKTMIEKLPIDLKYGGLLKTFANYNAVLLINTQSDYQLHYLATISKSGKIIDTLALFSGSCAEDELFFGESKYVIDTNINVLQTDTSAIFVRNEQGQIIKDSTKSASHIFRFHLTVKGEIVKD